MKVKVLTILAMAVIVLAGCSDFTNPLSSEEYYYSGVNENGSGVNENGSGVNENG